MAPQAGHVTADPQPQKPAPVLLTGGNPQIPKSDGDGPVCDYIAAMPGWKQGVGAQIDALITHVLPDVRKALKPLPPVASKQAKLRSLQVSETTPLDAAQFTDWVRQASLLPGEKL